MEQVQERRSKGWDPQARAAREREQHASVKDSACERGEWARQAWRSVPSGAPPRGWGKRSS